MWGIGSVAGATVGGFSVRLASKYPKWFKPTGFFARFPYVVPNLMAASLLLISLILSIFLLKEPPKGKRGYRRASVSHGQEMQEIQTGSIYDATSPPPTVRQRSFSLESGRFVPLDEIEPIELEIPNHFCSKFIDLSLLGGVLRNKAAMVSFGLYGLIGFAYTIFGTIFPLMLIAPSIGINFTTDGMVSL
jgi:hypothetical protein